MMLFATTDRPDGVHSALRQASRSTGADFEYLLATAQRESNLDPAARAATSSARGLFQFIESTWFAVFKEAGARHGYDGLASRIELGPEGYAVADAQAREQILALREDPRAAALMAGELTRRNEEALRAALGREPSDGELYLAHFLGARGAGDLVRLAETEPEMPAHLRFSAAARANPAIFYAADGQPRTVAEVHAKLTASHSAPTGGEPSRTAGLAEAPHRETANAFHSLFNDPASARGLGPIGRSVGAFWSGFHSPADKPDG